MRCHKARQKLIDSRGKVSEIPEDNELLKHLQVCPDCAAFARAERTLNRDIKAAGIDDNTDIISLSNLKANVEARAGFATPSKCQEKTIMVKLFEQIKKRPRLGISMAAVAVLLLIATLAPLKFDNPIGYEVAFAGVDKDLAMDSEKIDQLLEALGCEDAVVIVGDCEATCRLIISDLESEGDVQIIIAAFNELGNTVLEEIKEIHSDESVIVFNSSRDDMKFFGKTLVEIDEGEVHEIVIKCLGDLDSMTDGTFNLWFTNDSCEIVISEFVICDSGNNNFNFIKSVTNDDDGGQSHSLIQIDESSGPRPLIFKIRAIDEDYEKLAEVQLIVDDNGGEEVIVYKDGDIQRIDLTDEDAAERLKELGIVMNAVRYCQTSDPTAVYIQAVKGKDVEEDEDDEDSELLEVEKEYDNVLPDRFELNQNYPNPFNPYTSVLFSIPQTEHVTLEVFNIKGQKVRTLVNEVLEAGSHSAIWDSKSNDGIKVASGTYMYRIKAGDFTDSKKMTLLK